LYLLTVIVLAFPLRGAATPLRENPVVTENQLAGSTNWFIAAEDLALNHEIEGYAASVSVNRGEGLVYYVRSSTPSYTVAVYRMGWYGGAGARQITSFTIDASGRPPQPDCPEDSNTGLIECAWRAEEPLATATWPSGVYVLKLTTLPQTGPARSNYILAVVREDARRSDVLFVSSPTTYQAYNTWGGSDPGKSLYSYGRFLADGGPDELPNGDRRMMKRAVEVSFNRPYFFQGNARSDTWQPLFLFLKEEYPMIRFLEREGEDVTYTTDLDIGLDRDGPDGSDGGVAKKANLNHGSIFVVGHGEYWSMETREALERARDNHVNLAFLAANTGYWQIRYAPSPLDGGVGETPNRRVIGYKESAMNGALTDVVPAGAATDPFFADNVPSNDRLITGLFRDGAGANMPENRLLGVMYDKEGAANGFEVGLKLDAGFIRQSTPLMNGVEVQDGGVAGGILGYEADGILAPMDGGTQCLRVLGESHWYVLKSDGGMEREGPAHTVLYRPPYNGGGTVFSSGTILWSWGLDSWASLKSYGNTTTSLENETIKGVTRNLLRWFRQTPTGVSGSGCYLPPMPRRTSDLLSKERFYPGVGHLAKSNGSQLIPQTPDGGWLSGWAQYDSYRFLVGDFDGDGSDDLAAKDITSPGNLDVALGKQTRMVHAPSSWLTDTRFANTPDFDFLAGDVDGDGADDLIIHERLPPYGWTVAKSDKTRFLPPDAGQYWLTGWAASDDAYDLFVGDFDGDGRDDLLAKEKTDGGYWDVALSRQNGLQFVPQGPPSWLTGWAVASDAYNLFVGDFDGDGKDDVAAKEKNSPGYWYVATSDGSKFNASPHIWMTNWHVSSASYDFFTGDFDGDGDTDLLSRKKAAPVAWDMAFSDQADGGRFVRQPAPWSIDWSANDDSHNFFIGNFDID
jgi:hypothetical protein